MLPFEGHVVEGEKRKEYMEGKEQYIVCPMRNPSDFFLSLLCFIIVLQPKKSP
jgi:hypothetical protein